MAYFYVKNSLGTRTTGGGTTKQTGSFATLGAANVYATIALAITDGAGDGDLILCSDAHDYDAVAGAVTISGPTAGGEKLIIMSVSDTAMDAYAYGATERNSSGTGADVTITGHTVHFGMIYKTVDLLLGAADASRTMYNCRIDILNGGNSISPNGDGVNTRLFDCDIHCGAAASNVLFPSSNMRFIWHGGKIVDDSGAGGIDAFSSSAGSGGGASIDVRGVDLSAIDGNGTAALIQGHGASDFDDPIHAFFDLCKVHANITKLFEQSMVRDHSDNWMMRCTSSTTEGEYQLWHGQRGGVIESDSAVYRDGSTAFEETNQKISYKLVTTARASIYLPFIYDFPTRYVELATAATDNITIYFISETGSMTKEDVWAVAMYPDGTNKNVGNFITSSDNAISGSTTNDPIGTTGTALTTNSESWTESLTTPTKYELTIDTSADAGADCIPDIVLWVAKPSITIYFCPTVALS